ncbi:MAG TPA: phosphoribosylanthranilate isomerase [Chitinispirillaceae bacterium]|jgi:phosphoribosylanthranilate isomerase|nr:phosphoribosylanthranilate isomerase [Chitinispirillaceae bacterium]
MSLRVKICGITRYDDARIASNLGVDALGFIFYSKSPRNISPSAAREIINQLPPFISKVGVFVNQNIKDVISIAQVSGIDTVQLHGSETPDMCSRIPYPVIKSFSVKPDSDLTLLESYHTAGILLDTWHEQMYGGTGDTFDWEIARKACEKFDNIILAGGLNPSNLEEALRSVQPYGVDLNSGLELKPGIKNPIKMREAIRIIKNWKPV